MADSTVIDFDFDRSLGRARLEARDPSLAHWAVGFAHRVDERVGELCANGSLTSFNERLCGLGKCRVPSRDDMLFRDGSGLVRMRRDEPWEAAELAAAALRERGEVWVCVRLALSGLAYSNGGMGALWASAAARREDEGRFEEFWARMALELARCEVRAVAEASTRGGSRERADRLDELARRSLALDARDEISTAAKRAGADGAGPARV